MSNYKENTHFLKTHTNDYILETIVNVLPGLALKRNTFNVLNMISF